MNLKQNLQHLTVAVLETK